MAAPGRARRGGAAGTDRVRPALAGQPGAADIAIRPLDIPRLLAAAPVAAGLEQQPPFRNLAFTNTDEDADYGPMV